MVELVSAKLSLYVWRGSLNAVPSMPTYVLQKTKLSTETIIVFEIAELVKDYVEVIFDGDYRSIVQTSWVYWQVDRTYSDNSTDKFTQYAMAFRGYGDVKDGINPELSKDVMMTNRVVHNKCGESMNVPVYTLTGDGVTEVVYVNDGTPLDSIITGSSNVFSVAQSINIAAPSDIITIDKTLSTVASSNDIVTSPTVPADADEITFTSADGTTTTVYIECLEDCKNEPRKLSFINKFGVMQDMWFFAKKTESFSSEVKSYKKSTLNIGNSASYSASEHQNQYLKNQGKEKITMSTGFVDESYGELIKELIVSEYVYIADKVLRSPTDPAFPLAVPIKVASRDFDVKTRRNDKLIEYTLEFEADSDFIQSVR